MWCRLQFEDSLNLCCVTYVYALLNILLVYATWHLVFIKFNLNLNLKITATFSQYVFLLAILKGILEPVFCNCESVVIPNNSTSSACTFVPLLNHGHTPALPLQTASKLPCTHFKSHQSQNRDTEMVANIISIDSNIEMNRWTLTSQAPTHLHLG